MLPLLHRPTHLLLLFSLTSDLLPSPSFSIPTFATSSSFSSTSPPSSTTPPESNNKRHRSTSNGNSGKKKAKGGSGGAIRKKQQVTTNVGLSLSGRALYHYLVLFLMPSLQTSTSDFASFLIKSHLLPLEKALGRK